MKTLRSGGWPGIPTAANSPWPAATETSPCGTCQRWNHFWPRSDWLRDDRQLALAILQKGRRCESMERSDRRGNPRPRPSRPNGRRIVTGCWDQMAKVWDATTRELLTLKGHINSVWSVAFSPAGNEGAYEQ